MYAAFRSANRASTLQPNAAAAVTGGAPSTHHPHSGTRLAPPHRPQNDAALRVKCARHRHAWQSAQPARHRSACPGVKASGRRYLPHTLHNKYTRPSRPIARMRRCCGRTRSTQSSHDHCVDFMPASIPQRKNV